ncbi:MAG TPA: selenium cofactor biosynthesis protein YqeC [Candidatus Sulfotelmatobacter sp.]|nr:selenium cofactor biosynthesis protein YqeC [Candidatus Sulfotelmatobacter sp.]
MTLAEALGVRAGDVVSFIGAGGKTTAMYRLAAELAARGLKVIVTTTTKIFPPDVPDVALILEGEGGGGAVARVAKALGRTPIVAVAARALADGKLEGLSAEAVAALRELPAVAAVLVEADGSARKPFKAPAPHEPVIPAATTLVVAVVGADALGRPLAEDLVHRAALAAEQAGIHLGDPITPEAVARVLLGPANLRGKPAGARLAGLITKARTPALRDAAERLARLLGDGGASPVVVAELVAAPGFIEPVG